MLLINIIAKFGQKNSSYSSHKKKYIGSRIHEDKDSMKFSRSFGQKNYPVVYFLHQFTNQVCLFSRQTQLGNKSYNIWRKTFWNLNGKPLFYQYLDGKKAEY